MRSSRPTGPGNVRVKGPGWVRSRTMTTGVEYMSVAYSEQLDAASIKPSTGAVGSSYDHALAELRDRALQDRA